MTVRVYTSLDTGAPVLTGSRLVDRVKLILMACLVNGYGSKPAAGWTIGHQHADGFSLGNGEGFINLINSGSSAYIAYIMETVTDGSTALAAGVNRRSGVWSDGSPSGSLQYFYNPGFLGSSNLHWLVVADSKTCILMLGAGSSTADLSGGNGAAHYFGNYLNQSGLGSFCSLGGYSSSGGGALMNSTGMMLRHPFTGVVGQGSDARYAVGSPSYYGSGYAVVRAQLVTGRVQGVRAGLVGYGAAVSGSSVASSTVFCGYLRGLVADPVLSFAAPSQVFPALGLSNTWQARVTPFTLPDGKQWVPLYPHVSDLGFFVSLDEADWG